MEVREIDLGQVLEQQALTGDGGHKWNMNFIRLTWQQMLTAVKTAASIDIKLGWLSCFIVYFTELLMNKDNIGQQAFHRYSSR